MTEQLYPSESFYGRWTYRSFLSDPTHEPDLNSILYGEGDLVVNEAPTGAFRGKLDLGSDYQLTLRGSMTYGLPFTIRFQGTGVANSKTAGWVYDYLGFVVPIWPNEVDQRPAIIGSNIRTVPHDGQPAGFVAQWIAVKQY